MMVTVLLSPVAACWTDFVAFSAARQLFVRRRRLAQRDTGDRLAAERVVGEKGYGEESDQEQSEQHGQRLHRSERQPEPALLALCLLSERRAQIVGHFRHGPPRITGADDTTARRGHGSSAAQQKGRPEGRPFFDAGADSADQFAALVAGLSIAALSPVAGAAVAVDLMPCSRSAAVFSALSSLASGGT